MIKKYFFLVFILAGTVSVNLAQKAIDEVGTQKLSINTDAIEYAPTLSADGKTMVFQSNREGGGFRLYETQKQKDGTWSPAAPIEEINRLGAPGYRIGGPSLSSDGKTLYFCAILSGQKGDMDIYYSEKNDQNVWSLPRVVGAPISTQAEETFPSISPDGKKLFFARTATTDSDSCPTIFYSELDERNQWQTPQPLPATINSGCAKSPYFAYNNKTLFFSKQQDNQYFLYRSDLTGANSWTEPVLCNYLNTTRFEKALYPTLSSFEDFIYYTHQGDLYATSIPATFKLHGIGLSGTITDEENRTPAIATLFLVDSLTQDTLYPMEGRGSYVQSIPANGTYRIGASAKGYHPYTSEWYTPTLQEPYKTQEHPIVLRPYKTTYIFQVSDGDKGLKAKIKVTNLDTGEEFVYDAEAGRDGQYAISLREGNQYQVEVSSNEGYTTSTQTIVAKETPASNSPVVYNVALTPASSGSTSPKPASGGTTSDQYLLFYPFNSIVPDSASYQKLERLVALLKQPQYSYKYVEISGHTDVRGTEQYNLYFSQKRTQEIATILHRRGIPTGRIKARGYGESRLLNKNDTEEAHQQNRRVEIKIIR